MTPTPESIIHKVEALRQTAYQFGANPGTTAEYEAQVAKLEREIADDIRALAASAGEEAAEPSAAWKDGEPANLRAAAADAGEWLAVLAAAPSAPAAPHSTALQQLIAHAEGRLPHAGNGLCPDAVEGHDARDPECPVCRALDAVVAPQVAAAPAKPTVARRRIQRDAKRFADALEDAWVPMLPADTAALVEVLRSIEGAAAPEVAAPDEPRPLYVEARQCSHCNHIGINDASDDHCPGCDEDGTMTAACPKCGAPYQFLADAMLDASSAAQAACTGGAKA